MTSLTRELFSTSLFTVRFRTLFVALSLAALTAGGCSKAPTKDELLARANDDFATQQYDRAEKAYREVLRLTRLSLLKEKIVEYQWEDPKSLHYRAVLTQVLQSMMRIAEF